MARPRPNRVRERRAIFGDAVRDRRIAEGLTQEALAERAGIDRKSISRIENGAFSPSLDRIWLIADALRVSVTDLIGSTGSVEPRDRD